MQGKKQYIFKENLKILKANIKVWNYEVFGKLNLNVSEVVRHLNDLDHLVALDDVALGLDQSNIRVEAHSAVWQKLHLFEFFFRKKSSVFGRGKGIKILSFFIHP